MGSQLISRDFILFETGAVYVLYYKDVALKLTISLVSTQMEYECLIHCNHNPIF